MKNTEPKSKAPEVEEFYARVIDLAKIIPSSELDHRDSQQDAGENMEQHESSIYLTAQALIFTTEYYVLGKILQLRPETILDVGCAAGMIRNSLRRHRNFTPYIGMDVRNMASYIEKDRYSKFLQTNLVQSFPVVDGSCDTILFSEVLEHLLRDEGELVLRRLTTALKPGGHLVMTVPVFQDFLKLDREDAKFGHVYFWPQAELRAFLEEQCDMDIQEAWTARFIGDRHRFPAIRAKAVELYGTGGGDLLDTMRARFGNVVTCAMFMHVLPLDEGTDLQLVARKRG